MQVVIAGGGIAGAEALLALRALAGDRVSLTLVSDNDELALPALSVAEPFALGRAERHSLGDLVEHVGAEWVRGSLAAVEPADRRIRLKDRGALAYDALIIATGARPVAVVEHATTWWPGGNPEGFGGLLRDLEEGYTRRVAFVIPPGAVWPLPLYELAMMTAREVAAMGIDGAEFTVITPEAIPLALFGYEASTILGEALAAAGVRLETARSPVSSAGKASRWSSSPVSAASRSIASWRCRRWRDPTFPAPPATRTGSSASAVPGAWRIVTRCGRPGTRSRIR